MSDSHMRSLERAALSDPQAAERLQHMKQRSGQGRHNDKIGLPVVIYSFRDHFRGTLQGVTELSGGQAIAHLHPLYWCQNIQRGPQGEEVKIPSSEDCPADLYLNVQVIALQPESWA